MKIKSSRNGEITLSFTDTGKSYLSQIFNVANTSFKAIGENKTLAKISEFTVYCWLVSSYEDCSNMNASSFITFFTYMLRQNGKRFYKGLFVTFELAPDLKINTVYLSSYSPLNEGHVSILTNSMHRTYTSDIDV